MSTDTPNVVGLDLSITATGVCGHDTVATTWKLAASKGDTRLSTIADLTVRACNFCVDLAVIEDLPTHAHGAGITGMVHGAVRVALQRLEVPYALVTPATLKKYATGKGNAGKPDMAVALYKRTGLELADDNQVDAFWLRAMGLDHLGAPLVELPASQRDAMAKVAWPVEAP
jgi:Holliday junction resolvasome RuvABC endonuclease subunit